MSQKRIRKSAAAIIALSIVLILSGCAESGTPQAKQAALDYAESSAVLNSLAAGGTKGDVTVSFVNKWSFNGVECETYQVTEKGGTLDYTSLVCVAKIGGEWKEVALDKNMKYVGDKYTEGEINDFESQCRAEIGNQEPSAAVDREEKTTEKRTEQNVDPVDLGSNAFSPWCENGQKYKDSSSGKSFTIEPLDNGTGEAISYSLKFDDGAEDTLEYDGLGYDNNGDDCLNYKDDGFGLEMKYQPEAPKLVYLIGSSRGSQEYAGCYDQV